MLITVANVDNEQASKHSLTFVNEFRAQKQVPKQLLRDFRIRGEMCNFAAEKKRD